MGVFLKFEFIGNYNALYDENEQKDSVQKTIYSYGGDHIVITKEGTDLPPARYVTFRMTLGQYILLLINEPKYREYTAFNAEWKGR